MVDGEREGRGGRVGDRRRRVHFHKSYYVVIPKTGLTETYQDQLRLIFVSWKHRYTCAHLSSDHHHYILPHNDLLLLQ